MDTEWIEWILANVIFIIILPFIIFVYGKVNIFLIPVYFGALFFAHKYAVKKVKERMEMGNVK